MRFTSRHRLRAEFRMVNRTTQAGDSQNFRHYARDSIEISIFLAIYLALAPTIDAP